MTEQFTLPLARADDPQTSHDAKRSITPDRTEALILAAFAAHGPMTDDELAGALRLMYAPTVKTARSRLSATERNGEPVEPRLVPSGKVRRSARGRKMIVWRVSP